MNHRFDHPTFAQMRAENERLWAAATTASDAVTKIIDAAKDAVAADAPVRVEIPLFDPSDGTTTVYRCTLIDDWLPEGDEESIKVAIRCGFLERVAGETDYVLNATQRQTLDIWRDARLQALAKANEIRGQVYQRMGYDAAIAAYERAEAAAEASHKQLNSAEIHTMSDAIAALECVWDTDCDWDGLGERAMAFLKERVAA